MTPQLDEFRRELDEILNNLLGEFHKHKCMICNGKNGGCVNCRKTGYDQTPCKICDKDGIAFKNKQKAKSAITQLLIQARIDELDKLVEQYGEFRDETTGKTIDLKAVTLYRITSRINKLEALKTSEAKDE